MTPSPQRSSRRLLTPWRIARWGAALALLATPLIMMRISDEWRWGAGSFVFAGVMIGGAGLLYELAERASQSLAYRAGAAVAVLAAFLTVWTTIVRDDGDGAAVLLLVVAALVSAFAARFHAAGLARAMLGVAAMQGLLGLLTATSPATANAAGGPARILLFHAVFAAMWLVSGALFFAAARRDRAPGSTGVSGR